MSFVEACVRSVRSARTRLLLIPILVTVAGLALWIWSEVRKEKPAILHSTILYVPDEEAMMGDAGPSIVQVTRDLDELERKKSFDALYRARRGLGPLGSWEGDPPRAHPQKHRARREELLRLWLRMFRLIDAAVDPSFNPKDMAKLNVLPPVDYPVNQMSDIKDPVLRAEYERAVAENERKGKYWIFQTQLRKYGAEFEPDLGDFMRAWFSSMPADQEELEAAIRGTITNPERVERLLRMVPR
jgi:hypothetical protein